LGGTVADLGADRGQRPWVGPGPGGSDEDLLGLVPVLIGDGAGPPGQLQGDRLGEHVPLGQRSEQNLVAAGQRLDRLVLGGLARGHPGHVHQPGPGRALPVGDMCVLGIEGLQQATPDSRLDRVDSLQHPEASGQFGLGQIRGFNLSEESHCGLQHVKGLIGASRNRHHSHAAYVTSIRLVLTRVITLAMYALAPALVAVTVF